MKTKNGQMLVQRHQCRHHRKRYILSFNCFIIFSTKENCNQSVKISCDLRLFFISESESEVTQSCPTLCDPMNCNLPGSSVHGIFQVRVLEWVAISFSRGSSRPRDQTRVSHIVGRHFTVWATMEVLFIST